MRQQAKAGKRRAKVGAGMEHYAAALPSSPIVHVFMYLYVYSSWLVQQIFRFPFHWHRYIPSSLVHSQTANLDIEILGLFIPILLPSMFKQFHAL
jgi:hypothetical protein